MALTRCCCCDLRGGTLAIGITLLVLTVVGLCIRIPDWIALAQLDSGWEEAQQNVSVSVVDVDHGPQANATLGGDADDVRRYVRDEKIKAACQAVESVLTVVFNALLIHGVRRERPRLVLAWLVYHGVTFSLCTVAGPALIVVGVVIISGAAWAHLGQVGAAVCFIAGVLVMAVTAVFWYLWAVVFAYRRQLTGAGGGGKRDTEMADRPPTYQPIPRE